MMPGRIPRTDAAFCAFALDQFSSACQGTVSVSRTITSGRTGRLWRRPKSQGTSRTRDMANSQSNTTRSQRAPLRPQIPIAPWSLQCYTRVGCLPPSLEGSGSLRTAISVAVPRNSGEAEWLAMDRRRGQRTRMGGRDCQGGRGAQQLKDGTLPA
ncbi:hypothetical protein B0T11DRAFT_81745 [Plectosphaerella cucumerina]|uniref:Uncharacterized protein n=1 Tax=Plectosphaerella cucumerina TaxID=40658 RepID=A0A8K0TCP5_9PEZI|nr:hypothetical protein B0T11DRAFT_81745 [Plectosphaerella cucumerina]